MKYCIRCNYDYGMGTYVSENGGTTNHLDKILVTAANNVLEAACKHWKSIGAESYEVVEFDITKIRQDL